MDLSRLDIMYIHGIGPKRADLIKSELNIHTAEQLLNYFPYKHVDRSRIYQINEINGTMPFIQIKGEIRSFAVQGQKKDKRLIALFSDETGSIALVWFKRLDAIIKLYKPYTRYVVFGRPSIFGDRISIVHPEIEPYNPQQLKQLGFQPYYNTTERLKRSYINSKFLQTAIYSLLQSYREELPETLPDYLVKREKLMNYDLAIRTIHFPSSPDLLRQAEYRLKFEELFYLQLQILRYMYQRKQAIQGFLFPVVGDYFNTFFYSYLPFPLTSAQKRVIKEIRMDMRSGKQMNRLLQGDVGSGKTLVALMTMLLAADNGFQSCIMAPTEILANQHYETISSLLKELDIRVALLTGSVRKSVRLELFEQLREGKIQILVGTHALIEDSVVFYNLGYVIIDEQHRFGVEQRSKLWRKNTVPPHVLVMTATPIPRTLAMTLYGDLDVSIIDELPPGRKPVKTLHYYESQRAMLYRSIEKQIEQGRQIYIVYPLIQENEKMDYKNLEEGYEQIQQIYPQYKVCMVHGNENSRKRCRDATFC